MRLLQYLIGFFLLILLAGCSTVAPPATPPAKQLTWQERQTQLSQLQDWHLNGKIAVQTTQDAGSATIDWRQRKGSFNVSLFGPLGTNGLKLTGTPGKVTMETSDGKRLRADSAERLLAEGWGFHLPVSYLRYWVRGLPVPGIAAKPTLDQYQRLTSLTQDGWHVQYQSYTSLGNLDLPSRLTIYSPTLKTKLVIYSWSTT